MRARAPPFFMTRYAVAMLVDVEAVGDELLTLPITADCVVPTIEPEQPFIDFGDTFIGHTYESPITIYNVAHLPAKFEVVPEVPMLCAIGEYEAEPSQEIISGHGSATLSVRFKAGRLGSMRLPLYVKIAGMDDPSFVIDLKANAIGPIVTVVSTKIDWGRVKVLVDTSRSLTLRNESLVPAEYTALLRKPGSPFAMAEGSGTLAAGEIRDITITANLDDTVRASNDVIVQVINAPEQVVALVAVGVGATILPTRDLEQISFGEHFSNRAESHPLPTIHSPLLTCPLASAPTGTAPAQGSVSLSSLSKTLGASRSSSSG